MTPESLHALLDLLGQQHAMIIALQEENARLRGQLAGSTEDVPIS